ncbi:MAG: hypothetical protein IPL60_04965 [Ardenticatenia bacterium]|nr:hypothetical protein [Ardenticatenia bacterium]
MNSHSGEQSGLSGRLLQVAVAVREGSWLLTVRLPIRRSPRFVSQPLRWSSSSSQRNTEALPTTFRAMFVSSTLGLSSSALAVYSL